MSFVPQTEGLGKRIARFDHASERIERLFTYLDANFVVPEAGFEPACLSAMLFESIV